MTEGPRPTIKRLREVLDYDPDTGALAWKPRRGARWNERYAGKPAFCTLKDGYLAGRVLCYSTRAHRVVWAIVHGYWPYLIDHINGDKTDNRLVNLREGDHSLNGRNMKMHPRNTSGCMGVNPYKGRWRASITVAGRVIRLGSFLTKEEAIAARKAAEAEHGFTARHGEAA